MIFIKPNTHKLCAHPFSDDRVQDAHMGERRKRMRTQTYGVEIETKGLTRHQALSAVAEALDSRVMAYGTRVIDPETGKTWKAVPDGSLSGTACEVVTPPLTYDELPKLQDVVRTLRAAGARVDSECGLHVHVDASRHDGKSLARLAKLTNAKEDILCKALGVSESRLRRYAKKVNQNFLNRIARRTLTDQQLQGAWYGERRRRGRHYYHGHYDSSRYHGLNLHAVWTHGTIEFRYFNGTLHAGKIKSYVQLCLALSHKALTSKGASARKSTSTNEKFTFRVWLVSLGLKGAEFKTARKHLLANLDGNSAWRNGRPARTQTAVAV